MRSEPGSHQSPDAGHHARDVKLPSPLDVATRCWKCTPSGRPWQLRSSLPSPSKSPMRSEVGSHHAPNAGHHAREVKVPSPFDVATRCRYAVPLGRPWHERSVLPSPLKSPSTSELGSHQ